MNFTFDDLYRYVGRPATDGATYCRALRNGAVVMAWEDAINDRPGWWWAIVRDKLVLAIGFCPGGRVDRDAEIAGAIMGLEPVLAAPARRSA